MNDPEIVETLQCLTFKLKNERFAVDIRRVREALEFTSLMIIPHTPEFMCGMINLRGRVVPVVDLRLKLGIPKGDKTIDTCIIIVELTFQDETRILGMLVDSVQEVINLEPQDISSPPNVGADVNPDYFQGMGKYDDQFLIIIDVDQIFSLEEQGARQTV